MLFRTLTFFLLLTIGPALSAQVTQAELQSRLQLDTAFSGMWYVDPLNSASAADRELYFENFSFTPTANIPSTLVDTINARPIVYAYQLGLIPATDYHLLSAGEVTTEIDSKKKDDGPVRLTAYYLVVKSAGLTKLHLILTEPSWRDEFRGALSFEVLPRSAVSGDLTLLSGIFQGSYQLRRTPRSPVIVDEAPRVNDLPELNEYGLKGRPRSVGNAYYDAYRTRSGQIATGNLMNYHVQRYSEEGLLMTESGHRLDYYKKELFADSAIYSGPVANRQARFPREETAALGIFVPDRLTILRTDTSSTFVYYRDTIRRSSRHRKLVNGRIVLTWEADEYASGFNTTTQMLYGTDGFVVAEVYQTAPGRAPQGNFFYYAAFDERGNWTKCVVFEDAGFRQPRYVQVRWIEYY